MEAPTSTCLPVFPSPGNAFAVQPIHQGYIPAARAVAASMIYRYTGINTGYGVAEPFNTSSKPTEHTIDSALKSMTTPLHFFQVVMAEWLLVYAALARRLHEQDKPQASFLKASLPEPFHNLVPVDSPASLLSDDQCRVLIASEQAMPSLAAVLVFLTDWYGGVAASYCRLTHGDIQSTVEAILPMVHALRPSRYDAKHVLRTLLAEGMRMAAPDFFLYLNKVLGNGIDKNPHPCAAAVTLAEGSTMDLRVCESTSASKDVSPAMDATLVYSPELVVPVPTKARASSQLIDTLLSSKHAGVVRTAQNHWMPLLPSSLVDAALEYVAVQATTMTLVKALQTTEPAPRDAQEVLMRARMLYFTSDDRMVEDAVKTAFAARFGTDVVSVDEDDDDNSPPKEAEVSDRLDMGETSTEQEPKPEQEPEQEPEFETEFEPVLVSESEPERQPAFEAGTAGVSVAESAAPPERPAEKPTTITENVHQPSGVELNLPLVVEDFSNAVVRPGRHVYSGHSLLTLYYTPHVYRKVNLASEVLEEFFQRYTTLRDATGGTFFAHANTGDAVLQLHKQPDGTYLPSLSNAKLDASVCTPLTCAPFRTIVLMREDLLAIATTPADAPPRTWLRQLFDASVKNVAGRNFHDAKALGIVNAVCMSAPDRVVGAAKWCEGAMLELLLPGDAWPVVHKLDRHLAAQCVVTFDDGAVGLADTPDAAGDTVVHSVLQRDGLDFVVVRLEQPETVRFERVVAWSEPFMRGFALTTTQLSIAAALGAECVRAALGQVAALCTPEDVNMSTLSQIVQHDKEEFTFHLREELTREGPHVSPRALLPEFAASDRFPLRSPPPPPPPQRTKTTTTTQSQVTLAV